MVPGGGGVMSIITPTKREGRKVFSHAEGGGVTKSFRVVLTQDLEFLAILKEGLEFSTLQRGGGHEQFYPVSKGGLQNASNQQLYYFVALPSLLVIDDQSLTTALLHEGAKWFQTCDFPIM